MVYPPAATTNLCTEISTSFYVVSNPDATPYELYVLNLFEAALGSLVESSTT